MNELIEFHRILKDNVMFSSNYNFEPIRSKCLSTVQKIVQEKNSPINLGTWMEYVDKKARASTSSDRTFLALVTMMLSPLASDTQLLEEVLQKLPYHSPRSLFSWAKKCSWDGSYHQLIQMLVPAQAHSMNGRKSK